MVIAAAVTVGCGGPAKETVTPVNKPVVEIRGGLSSGTADSFVVQCNAGLTEARRLVPEILEVEGARTSDNTLEPYNDLLIAAGGSSALAGLMSEVHPSEAVRDSARKCEQEVSNFISELSLNREMYDALAAVDISKADAETKRFVEHTLRDYRRAGVDRDEATRTRVKEIDEELTKLGQQFSKNISEDVRFIEATSDRLGGLPQDFLDSHKPDATGKVKITTDYPDYNPFMMYAGDDDLRRQLYVAFRSRGDKDNERILGEVLDLRSEKAMLLGYANWADYVTEDKMMKSGKKAAEFIERINKLAQARAGRDYAELLKQLKTVDRSARKVSDWQKGWLENLVKRDKYQVDSSEIRKYFPYESVLAGLLDITAAIYDIEYVPSRDKVWHDDVKVFEVERDGQRLGRVYLDMHPREGKYKHAAQFTMKDGVAGRQLPEGVLVCNFPSPGDAAPALMEHEDVVTMFHEFGHLMHHILGGQRRWVRQSGVATEWDFVEAPSQMFEEWAWNHATLARFSKHVETGEVISAELVAKMRKADKFGLGTATVQQMFYAAISLNFHSLDASALDQAEEVKRLQKKYTPFEFVEGTKFHASFGHLIGYSAIYYTYMWSLVIAKDLLTPFEKKGLMDTEWTHAYRDKILAVGGTKDAAVMVKDFLGRDFSFKAFEKYLTQ
jgi:thimet oligopeptidase